MNTNLIALKQRFGIIGNSEAINRALETALQVAPTDLSVLVTGESGTGKETIPRVIHFNSLRKHSKYIAVNCGAIPEGTIDSELFGHEKGSFTGATESRKGYFEEANEGTIFLDEVAELPLQTQVRLLRVLETGEFMRVGSSKVEKTNVRIVAATNVNIPEAIKKGRFREDLYYRLSTVPITLPPLRERKEDIEILFTKFAADFADKYRMPIVELNQDAVEILLRYPWPGNIRQLKNITEQISIIEKGRLIDAKTFLKYLPINQTEYNIPLEKQAENSSGLNEREILYKILFELRSDVKELKAALYNLAGNGGAAFGSAVTNNPYASVSPLGLLPSANPNAMAQPYSNLDDDYTEEAEETLSLEDTEREVIIKALKKYNNKRKPAAKELGISERTLYRKIKEYDI
ncbi:MAG: sigma-54 interaction domain-containing protein [Luteibaculaceae bacterium]